MAIHLRLLSKSESSKLGSVKVISFAVAILAIVFIAGCSSFQGNERVSQQSRKTVFKAADESDTENVDAPPVREKVPGEETKPGR
jgi:PBP1b-binding outer membrane lipoprotein LpoB